jgi:alkanesulfonate monooxygenase SsuD/methylene tetrahydromethanopterin reductase-like flavin-dependent oxidoreductase (luciferase family)
VLCCGENEQQFRRRAEAIGRDPEELRTSSAAGTPDEVATTLRAWNAAGADRLYLQMLDLADLDHLDLVAERVAPDLD